MMKKILALILALCMVFALCACGSSSGDSATPAASSISLNVGTGGESGTYYGYTGILGTVIGQKTDIKLTVVATGGSKDNLVSMQDGMYDLATVQSDVMTYAYNGTNSFADSGKIAKWASDAMKAAYAMGYLTGSSSDGKLYAKPADTISRQEAMVILSRTLPESTASADDLEKRFSDADKVAKWAREPLAQMLQAGIISGSNGKLNPTGKVTRAQVAKMLYQLQQQ